MLIFDLLIAFGAFQAFFIAVIILAQGSTLPRKFFALFLVIEGITLVERLLVETDLIASAPHILGVSYPLSFVKPPILLLAAFAIVNSGFKLRKVHLLHFIPFLIFFLMNIPFYLQPAQSKIDTVMAFMEFVPTYNTFQFYLYFAFFLNIGAYIVATVVTLNRYRKHVKNNKLVNWYRWVLILYGITLIIGFVYFVIRPIGIIEIPFFNTISMLTMTFLVQSIAYSFFMQANVFNARNTISMESLEQMASDESRIRKLLEEEKVFLDDSLTLVAFAAKLDLSKKYVSDLFNQRLGNSFKDVINQYRVKEAQEIMQNETDNHTQLIAIGHESGFNNKVSFYRAFKRYTGKSPSEYFQSLATNRSN